MKKILYGLWLILLVFMMSPAGDAAAMTINNKCGFPVAGSLKVAGSNVNVAQFRLAPGEKIRLLKGFGKIKTVMHMTPDVRDLDKLEISITEIDNPDSYIELKQGKEGIRVKIY